MTTKVIFQCGKEHRLHSVLWYTFSKNLDGQYILSRLGRRQYFYGKINIIAS